MCHQIHKQYRQIHRHRGSVMHAYWHQDLFCSGNLGKTGECFTSQRANCNAQTPLCKNETEALPRMVVWAALYSCAKAPWLWSIWILNIQCSKQCPKYTGWMGLLSDHRGSTVHYRLKLPISFLSHSPCLRHPHLLSPLSVPLSYIVCIFLSTSLRPLHLSLWISFCLFGLFFFSSLCLSALVFLPLSLSCV